MSFSGLLEVLNTPGEEPVMHPHWLHNALDYLVRDNFLLVWIPPGEKDEVKYQPSGKGRKWLSHVPEEASPHR